MSQAKTGTIAVGAGASGLGVGVGVVLATGAVLGVGALALAMAAKGMVRVGKAIYDQVEDQLNAKIAEERRKRQELFRNIIRKPAFTAEDVYKADMEQPEPEVECIVQESRMAKEFIDQLESLKESRLEWEKERDRPLKPYISHEMENAINELKAKMTVKAGKPSGLLEKVTEQDIQIFYNEIDARCLSIEEIYPDIADETRTRMKTIKKTREVLKGKLAELNGLAETIRKNPILHDLSNIYNKYCRNGEIAFLQQICLEDYRHVLGVEILEYENLLKKFHENYKEKRSLAEVSLLNQEGIQEFGSKGNEVIGLAKKLLSKIIFEQDINNIMTSMRKQGFDRCKVQKRGKNYAHIIGWNEDNMQQIARALIKSPDNRDEEAKDLRLEIEGFESYGEKKAKGEGLARELSSMGLEIKWEESTHDRNNSIIKEPAELILKRKLPGANIKILGGNRVIINGRTHTWDATINVDEFIRRSKAPVSSKEPEKEREL